MARGTLLGADAITDGPPPPPPPPVDCGITDDFNRPNTTGDILGIATCGREWSAIEMHIDGNSAVADGFGPVGFNGPFATQAQLPGPWPVPFNGRIDFTAADIIPGFDFGPTDPGDPFPLGGAWSGRGNASAAGEYVVRVVSEGPYAHLIPLGFVIDPTEAWTVTGKLYMSEITKPSGTDSVGETRALDNYFHVSFSFGGAEIELSPFFETCYDPTSTGFQSAPITSELIGNDGTHCVDYPFPVGYWVAHDGLWVDFTAAYDGGDHGFGGTITLTVGPVTAVYAVGGGDHIDGFSVSVFPYWQRPPGDGEVEFRLKDLVYSQFSEDRVVTPISWAWGLDGEDADGNVLRYNLGYISFGGLALDSAPFWPPNEPGTTDPKPSHLPPLIYAIVSRPDADGIPRAVAYERLSLDAIGIGEAIVVITPTQATLSYGGATVTAVNAVAQADTGNPAPDNLVAAPIAPLHDFTSSLKMDVHQGNGTYIRFDNLDVAGVNACTAGVVPPGGYTFFDDFDSLDSAVWARNGYTITDATETHSYAAGNAFASGSILTLRASRFAANSWDVAFINTAGAFSQLYGLFEARIKIPKGRGLWPAFWGYPGVTSQELDIMEIGANPIGDSNGGSWGDASDLHTTIHFGGGGSAARVPPFSGLGDLSLDYHVYAMDWRAGYVSFLLDGVEVWRYTGGSIPNTAMSLFLDNVVGASFIGPSDGSTPDPSDMLVDWVRVSA